MINRGNYRRRIFANDGSAGSFEKVLFETCEQFGWRLHAYVVMNNHFHLAVETPEPNLSLGMKWLQGTWARRSNLYHGLIGRPFQGRYKALLVEPGHVLGQVAHYVHLNPVRAKIVASKSASDYRWSSLNRFVHGGRPGFLEAECLLSEAGGLPDTRLGWRKYCQYLAWLASDGPAQRARGFNQMSRGWCVGTSDFRLAMQDELLNRKVAQTEVSLLGTGAEEIRDLRESMWEQRLRKEAAKLKIRLDKLPLQKSSVEKVKLAAKMKSTTSVSNGWLAERLKMGKPATVSQYVCRFRLRQGQEK